MSSLTLTVPPSIEPLLVADLRDFRRVDDGAEQYLLETWLQTARQQVESYTGLAILTQTWAWKLDGFPADDFLEMPRNPLQSITSVQYVDTAGVTQTMPGADYRIVAPDDPIGGAYRLALGYGKAWPTTRDDIDAVTITFVAGYTERKAVPPAVLSAILLIAGELHEQRDLTVVGATVAQLPTVVNLLAPFRRRWF